ncbi:hypothetical protein VF09_36935 [Nostoc linckia z9]|nr:hypothetical protein VF09_36935 [Nostoc linckia z9]
MRSGVGLKSCSGVGLDDVEACGVQLYRESLWGPPVRGDDCVVERLHGGTNEEAHQERTARLQDPRKLVERGAYRAGFVVDERVPSEDPTDGAGGIGQVVEASQSEGHTGVGLPGVLDEFGHLINATHVIAPLAKVGAPVSGAASSVQDRAVDMCGP